MNLNKKERLLLKVSGASLKAPGSKYTITDSSIGHLTDQIKLLNEKYEIAIVIGGGNIWRGDENMPGSLKNKDTHVMGMLATLMNSIALQSYLTDKGVGSTIFSSITCPRIAEDISSQALNAAFARGDVVIFGGGTGMPFVTTDTCAAIRALEIKADWILVGKNGVDGVYDKDPNKHSDAKFFAKISYEEIIDRRIKVMDLAAMTLLINNRGSKLMVFNQDQENAFVRAINGDINKTEVY